MDEEGCIGWFLTAVVVICVFVILVTASMRHSDDHDHAQTRSGVHCEQEEGYMGQQVTICTDP